MADGDGSALKADAVRGRLASEPDEATQLACSVHEGVRNLVRLLPRITRGLRRLRGPVVDGGVALGNRHRSLLSAIYEREATVGALAESLGLNLATTSGLVADLERAGFAERYSDPADRRRTIVGVPVASRPYVQQWLDGSTAPLARALEHLSSQERAALVRAMTFLDSELNGPCQSTHGHSADGKSPDGHFTDD